MNETANNQMEQTKMNNTDKMRIACAMQRNPKGYAKLYRSKGELSQKWVTACSTNADEAVKMLQEHNK